MRMKIIAAASLFAASMATAAFAQPQYSSDDNNDGSAPTGMSAAAPVHYAAYTMRKSSDENGGYAPVRSSSTPAVDRMVTGSIKPPLPDCQSMLQPSSNSKIHTEGGDGGASRTDACRATR